MCVSESWKVSHLVTEMDSEVSDSHLLTTVLFLGVIMRFEIYFTDIACGSDVGYSSKPTGGIGAPQGGTSGRGGTSKSSSGTGTDWMCTVCGCVNFARRTLCFQVRAVSCWNN